MPSDRAEGIGAVTKPDGGLLKEVIKPRSALPPLLSPLGEKRPERCHWIGSAFGLRRAHNFWTRAGYKPVYLRQTKLAATGEHSAVVIRALDRGEEEDDVAASPEWLDAFADDFRRRFTSLLGGAFRDMPRGWRSPCSPRGWISTTSRAPGVAERRR